jgi:hypothetical protein
MVALRTPGQPLENREYRLGGRPSLLNQLGKMYPPAYMTAQLLLSNDHDQREVETKDIERRDKKNTVGNQGALYQGSVAPHNYRPLRG